MIETVLEPSTKGVTWIDIQGPTEAELAGIAETYGLHKTAVADSLQPTHLPKFEQFDKISFLIARSYDVARAPKDGETAQQLTNKLAIFVGQDYLITIHRMAQPHVTAVKEAWAKRPATKKKLNVAHPLNDLLQGVLATYAVPLTDCDEQLSRLEKAAFATRGNFPYRESYVLLRKASVIKRMLWMNLEVIRHLQQVPDQSRTFFQDLKEEGDRQLAVIDELLESVRSVVNLNIAIAGQRMNEASFKTNEIMRVLTLFSLFFLPLNFVAGVYGMNFEHIPWLKEPWGFWASLALMSTMVLTIFLWFRRQGWLKKSDYL